MDEIGISARDLCRLAPRRARGPTSSDDRARCVDGVTSASFQLHMC